jgi:serine/threonine-protein kinase
MTAPIPPTQFAPGTEVLGYTIQRVLGRGGMGTVYLARQNSLDREVALKVLHPSRLKNPASISAFLREARAAAKLSHAHLVAVHDVLDDQPNGLYCYSMEYVPGTTAAEHVHQHGVMKRAEALNLAYQVARALGHAHRANLVHRDVKPDNILITPGGTAKLLDLGLVRDRVDHAGEGATRTIRIVGTPEYAAPEQARTPDKVLPASDVWSLGATLFFLLVGRPPFTGETLIDMFVRSATEPLSYPDSVQPDTRHLIDLMMAKNVADRLPDGGAVVEALRALSEGRPLPDLPGIGTDDVGEVIGDLTPPKGTATTGDDDSQSSSSGSTRRRLIRRRRHR